jgi:serine/threonine protein phosphatase PrpC
MSFLKSFVSSFWSGSEEDEVSVQDKESVPNDPNAQLDTKLAPKWGVHPICDAGTDAYIYMRSSISDEDRPFCFRVPVTNGSYYDIRGVFDGHGGIGCVKWVVEILPGLFNKYAHIPSKDILGVVLLALKQMYTEHAKNKLSQIPKSDLSKVPFDNSGTTILLTLYDPVAKKIYWASIGDSSLIVYDSSTGKIVRLNPHDELPVGVKLQTDSNFYYECFGGIYPVEHKEETEYDLIRDKDKFCVFTKTVQKPIGDGKFVPETKIKYNLPEELRFGRWQGDISLTQTFGVPLYPRKVMDIHTGEYKIQEGSGVVMILCTDGVSDIIDENEFGAMISNKDISGVTGAVDTVDPMQYKKNVRGLLKSIAGDCKDLLDKKLASSTKRDDATFIVEFLHN